MTTDTEDTETIRLRRIRENKARRIARRCGYTVWKSSRRDRRAPDYGKWWVAQDFPDGSESELVAGPLDLAALETWLDELPEVTR